MPAPGEPQIPAKLGDAVRRVAAMLAAAGIEDAAAEARRLVSAALAIDALRLVVDAERELSDENRHAIARFAQRRCGREPLSRIVGQREFYGRVFEVTPATLDPRPDSETLVAAVLDLVAEAGWLGRPIRILDVGTGSGCLLATLLAELPEATGLATDIDPEALAVAARNAERLGVAGRAAFQLARSLEGLTGPFDLVVSNPPYIRTGDIAGLDPEVRQFDPRTALDGGADGLDIYHEIAGGLPRVLVDGWVVVEVGAGQSAEVADILLAALAPPGTPSPPVREASPKVTSRTWTDLGGHCRTVAVGTHAA